MEHQLIMKHSIRNFIIWIIHTMGISFLYRMYIRTKGPLVRVLAFHDVAERQWFEEVVAMLVYKYTVITPEQFHAKEFDTKKINVLLTFDDGYQSWIDVCAPVLKKYKLSALFFINSGLLDIAHESSKVATYMRTPLQITPKAPLTWEGAKTLMALGHSIGGHSVNHHNLAVLGQNDLEREIKEDKKRIEEQLEIMLTDFAYPFGRKNHYNTNVFGTVRKAGYTNAYSAQSNFCVRNNICSIPRTLVEKNQPLQSLKRWIEGGYDIFSCFK